MKHEAPNLETSPITDPEGRKEREENFVPIAVAFSIWDRGQQETLSNLEKLDRHGN